MRGHESDLSARDRQHQHLGQQNLARFGSLGAVYTTNQTAGRGRLGRRWENLPGCGLYYTAVASLPMVQPSPLPLYAGLALADVLRRHTGAQPLLKWPTDLLLHGKKLAGILCEGAHGAWMAGCGVNLCHPAGYFARSGLPHGTSLVLEGVGGVDAPAGPTRVAEDLSYTPCAKDSAGLAAHGIAPFLDEYRASCVNLGRAVEFDGGRGIARDIDAEGRLVVDTADGAEAVFTGEVSVRGIYGKV